MFSKWNNTQNKTIYLKENRRGGLSTSTLYPQININTFTIAGDELKCQSSYWDYDIGKHVLNIKNINCKYNLEYPKYQPSQYPKYQPNQYPKYRPNQS